MYHLVAQRAISIDGFLPVTWLSFLISAVIMAPEIQNLCCYILSCLVLWYKDKNLEVVQRLLTKSCSSGKLLLGNDHGLRRTGLSMWRLKQCKLVGHGRYHLSGGSTHSDRLSPTDSIRRDVKD